MARPRLRRRLKRAALAAVVCAALALAALAACWYAFPFPHERLERFGHTRLVTDRHGEELLSLVGEAQQWRTVIARDEMSPWITKATIAIEDHRFRAHPGIDPAAVVRAAGQNILGGRVVSGASTITMQVCRMMDDRPRTLSAKAVEAFRALQLDAEYTKDEILTLYLNTAPYGGNVRGVEAASWRYFGKPASRLTIAEAALLAGLPQSPERLRPDRAPQRARTRRNAVLDAMLAQHVITPAQHDAAVAEPVEITPHARRRLAPHAAARALQQRPEGGRTTIDVAVQLAVTELATSHAQGLPPGTDIGVVVLDVNTGDVLAMLGGLDINDPADGQVNAATARRSPGSALKPFVYAAAIDAGIIAPHTVIDDAPLRRGGWTPGNFGGTFVGAVSAADALRLSLNIPALLVAEAAGTERCAGVMRACGVSIPPEAATRAGLSLVTGGVETTLTDLTNAYATLARGGVHRPTRLFGDEASQPTRVLPINAAEHVNAILGSVHAHPGANASLAPAGWSMLKTGTSAGRRDALAVGHNRRVAIGVWVGRLAGGGHHAYVGATAAEPLFHKLIDHPLLASDATPPTVTSIQGPAALVVHPRYRDRLIHSPADGETLVARNGRAVLVAEAAPATGVWWLDDQQLKDTGQRLRLELEPGVYRLTRLTPGAAQSIVVRVIE